MSVRRHGNRYGIWVYDPARKDSVYIGSEPLTREGKRVADRRFADEVERRSTRAKGRELADVFARRWTVDFPRAPRTNRHNRERVEAFARHFAGRYLDEIAVPEADEWARANPGRLPAVRAMFNQARRLGLVSDNPFAKLGLDRSEGRKRVEPPTVDELWELADLCVRVHGDAFGWTLRGALVANAFVGWRPAEMAGAWWDDVHGDEIDVLRQWTPRSGTTEEERFVAPKLGSAGRVFLPEEARDALKRVPRRVGDPVIFRTLEGAMLSESTLHYWLAPVRTAFAAAAGNPEVCARRKRFSWYQLRHFCGWYLLNVKLLEPWMVAEQLRHDDGGVLVQKLYGHPSARVAREQIRRAFGSSVRPLDGASGASRERKTGESA